MLHAAKWDLHAVSGRKNQEIKKRPVKIHCESRIRL
jgi:hypothetical protein